MCTLIINEKKIILTFTNFFLSLFSKFESVMCTQKAHEFAQQNCVRVHITWHNIKDATRRLDSAQFSIQHVPGITGQREFKVSLSTDKDQEK